MNAQLNFPATERGKIQLSVHNNELSCQDFYVRNFNGSLKGMLADLNFPATRWLCNDVTTSVSVFWIVPWRHQGEKDSKNDQIQVSDPANSSNSKKPQINTRKENREEKRKRPFLISVEPAKAAKATNLAVNRFCSKALRQWPSESVKLVCLESAIDPVAHLSKPSELPKVSWLALGSFRIDSQPNAVLWWWPPPILPAPWLNPCP